MWTGTKGRFGLKYVRAEQTAVERIENMAAAKVEGPVVERHGGGAAEVSLSSLNDSEDTRIAEKAYRTPTGWRCGHRRTMPTAAAGNLKQMSTGAQPSLPLAHRRPYVCGNPSGGAREFCRTSIRQPVSDEMSQLVVNQGEFCTWAAAYSYGAELHLSCGHVPHHRFKCREHQNLRPTRPGHRRQRPPRYTLPWPVCHGRWSWFHERASRIPEFS